MDAAENGLFFSDYAYERIKYDKRNIYCIILIIMTISDL